MERMIVTSKKNEQYLHCSDCYDVLGVISKGEFDLWDVGWPCGNCGRLNKSSDDGQEVILDQNGVQHIVFTSIADDIDLIHSLVKDGFNFQRVITSRDLNPDSSSFGQYNVKIRKKS
jgi:hypothetical protein